VVHARLSMFYNPRHRTPDKTNLLNEIANSTHSIDATVIKEQVGKEFGMTAEN
jgi:hypothetical protein